MTSKRFHYFLCLALLALASLACQLTATGVPEAPVADSVIESGHTETAPAPSSPTPLLPSPEQPTQAPTASPTPTPGATSAPDNPCANPLYPLTPGNQWIYQVTDAEGQHQLGLTVAAVHDSLATIDMIQMETGVTSQLNVTCLEGALLNFPAIGIGFLFGDVDGEIVFEHHSGVFVPAQVEFEAQDWVLEWQGEYQTSGMLQATVDGDFITGSLQESPLRLNWISGINGEAVYEAVSVPAGEYAQTLRVERQVDFDFVAEFMEDGTSQSLAARMLVTNDLWFAPGVGLVRQTSRDGQVEALGMRFPVLLENTLELLEFRPAG